MIITKKYVFDLDNTLIYTDCLNNYSYNYALKCYGLAPINYFKRITREIVFKNYPQLTDVQKDRIVNLKRYYFINNLHITKGNDLLIKMLKSKSKSNCILWTSAERIRVKAILEYYNINKLFKNIFFSSKTNIIYDLNKICKLHNCKSEQLVFYEDNLDVIRQLEKLDLKVICVQ